MKKLFCFLIGLSLLALSCQKDSTSSDTSSSTLGGSTAIALNTVGNEFSGYVMAGNFLYDANESMKITSINSDGIITVKCTGTLPVGSPFEDLIPASFKDGSGNINCDLKFKNTSEGILDYTNADQKPLVLVKYNAKVGDKYVLQKSNGMVITRTVVSVSTTDDFPWGGMFIKTVNVEQDSRIPGVSTITYITNHRFGLVSIQICMDDDSTFEIVLNPTTY